MYEAKPMKIKRALTGAQTKTEVYGWTVQPRAGPAPMKVETESFINLTLPFFSPFSNFPLSLSHTHTVQVLVRERTDLPIFIQSELLI